jgi:putative transposase
MLNDETLALWFQRLSISTQTQSIIRQIRTSEPARRVGSRRYNVSGRYPSKKMGRTIQFESHRVELAEIYFMEHESSVLEYYDQPPPIKLLYKSVAGRSLGVLHTADYFVIRTDGAGWVECKTEEELPRLAQKSPHRYSLDDGRWRSQPGESYAAALGLDYAIRSSREINWNLQANLQFLEDYFGEPATLQATTMEQLQARVASLPGMTLEALFAELGDCCSRDDVYFMIAQDRVFVDLSAARLTDAGQVRVFANSMAAKGESSALGKHRLPVPPATLSIEAGDSVVWDARPWKVVNIGEKVVALLGERDVLSEIPRSIFDQLILDGHIVIGRKEIESPSNGEALARISKANEAELRRANYRHDCVCAFLCGKRTDSAVPMRTLRRWVSKYRTAERIFGNGFVGLLSDIGNRGNATPRIPEATRLLMEKFIADDYEALKQKNRRTCWMKFRLECEKLLMEAPSYQTFRLAIKKRSGFRQTLKRQGYRAACQQDAFYFELDLKTPRHGSRPLEIGHIDHTQLDLELICSLTGRRSGRPWLTILTDAFSRRILAFYVTYDSPSFRSCMMVMRECVYRHGRLPQNIVVDGGREFASIYFETLLARYQCIKKTRPPAQARFGSTCERLFGTTNSQFIHNLRGNTQITRKPRRVTKEVDPKGQAVWPLKELVERLAEYFYEVYDVQDHPALGETPRQAFDRGIASGGQRSHRMIAYDREFLIYTLPTPRRETARVIPGRGVKIHYLYYWCESFRSSDIENNRVEVRYDPFDVGTAYALVNGTWAECHSEYHSTFQGHSQKEVKAVTEEIRKRSQNHSQGFPVTARRLAQFLEGVEMQEEVLNQRLRDLEARSAQTHLSTADIGVVKLTDEQSPSLEYGPASESRQIYGEF